MVKTYRCVLCDYQVTEETLSRGLPYCSGCGTTCAPYSSDLDVNVKINWFELQVLVTWAENWAQQQKEDDGDALKAVHAIAHRVSAQHPNLPPLTLAKAVSQMGEIAYLAKTPPVIPLSLTEEEIQRLEEFCQQSGVIAIDTSPKLNSAGIEQLLRALRDRLPQITSSADLSWFLSEVTEVLNEVEVQIRGTVLRDEEKTTPELKTLPRQLAHQAALQLYEEVACNYPQFVPTEKTPFNSIPYLLWALTQIYTFSDQWDEDKLHRWLGWCQGISNYKGLTTLDEERDRIRTLKEEIVNDSIE